ncbi:dehydrogenase [Halostagnicola larsenii XH-48]|uniref:Dehydrogenase n=1 Tax=Halostagnicola larsenii XH-48 TaxID=797299 RepID=W0JMI3_9EURY|nr:selenium cofactor biosynthesis protein YqeC [Halostagnicola larsenii]AHF99920.1 dehydrogenase [Halostagnicola larsenii XH-48]
MNILEALRAESGTVCAVGAGGKKTTLYALAARAADGVAPETVVTASVRIPFFDSQVASVAVTEEPVSVLEQRIERETNSSATDGGWPLGLVPGRADEERYGGYDCETIDDIEDSGLADLVLVKADGARMRDFKAPADHEPQIPQRTDTVIPIASAHVVGEPLSTDLVHRPELVAEITGLEPGDEIRPTDVAAVLASERGGMKDVPEGATAVPLLNKIDDQSRRAVGTEIATELLERTSAVDRVVLARMIDDDPLVDVLE